MKKISISSIVKIGMIAAIYVVTTMALAPISYGEIQFRISEVLVLLAFINPMYIPGLVIGCILANLSSPLGVIDITVGSFATLLSVVCIHFTKVKLGFNVKSLKIAAIWPVLFNGILVGTMLYYLVGVPLFISIISVAIGEFVVVRILGVVVFKSLMNNKRLMDILNLNKTF